RLSPAMHLCAVLFCVLWSAVRAENSDDYELMYVNLDNEIDNGLHPTEDPTPCDCRREPSEWDKLFIMLEDSQMRESMLLQATDGLLRGELRALRAELGRAGGQPGEAVRAGRPPAKPRVGPRPWKKKSEKKQPASMQFHSMNSNSQGSLQALVYVLADIYEHRVSQLPYQTCIRTKSEFSSISLGYTALSECYTFLPFKDSFLQTFAKFINSSYFLATLGCETAILFPMRSKKIFGSVHPATPVKLESFSACIWVKATDVLNKTILFSYGTKRNPYEIQLYLSYQAIVLVVGGEENRLAADTVISLGKWTHLCSTWNSEKGRVSLWVNGGLVATTVGLATGHIVPEGGILQIGQEKNGCCVGGGFDETLAFSGRLTGFNIWDRVLSNEEIRETGGAESCHIRGNVVGWGVTEIQPHGGAQYVS
uniref:Pentraxin-related protein PTX3 n=1 Tax=Myotis lucifugus TaxID=59463 RepID=G1Q8I5_MYOLU